MNLSYIYKPTFYIYIFSYSNTVTMIGILVALYVKVLGILMKEPSAWHGRFLLKSIVLVLSKFYVVLHMNFAWN